MCHMISSTTAGRTKEKKWLMLQHCIARCFDKQAFSPQMKEMCHLSWNSPSFHYFVCPSAPAFVSPTASEVVFEGQRASLYLSVSAFLALFLSLSFSLFKIWSLTFVSAPTEKLWIAEMNHLSFFKSVWEEARGGKGSHICVGHICCNLFWIWTSVQWWLISHNQYSHLGGSVCFVDGDVNSELVKRKNLKNPL